MLRHWMVFIISVYCICKCTWCCNTGCLRACAHVPDATPFDGFIIVCIVFAGVLDHAILDVYSHVHTYLMLRHWMVLSLCVLYLQAYLTMQYWMFIRMCTRTWCYAIGWFYNCVYCICRRTWPCNTGCLFACAHVPDATPLDGFYNCVYCICKCTWCCNTGCLLACAHVPDATPLDGFIIVCIVFAGVLDHAILDVYSHVHTYLMLRHWMVLSLCVLYLQAYLTMQYWMFIRMCTRTWCYAIGWFYNCVYCICRRTWPCNTGCLFACAHVPDATPLDGFIIVYIVIAGVLDSAILDVYADVHTYLMLRHWMCFCMCTSKFRVRNYRVDWASRSSVQNQQVLCTLHFLTILERNKVTPSSRRRHLSLAPWNSWNDFLEVSTYSCWCWPAAPSCLCVYSPSMQMSASLGLHLGWVVVTNS